MRCGRCQFENMPGQNRCFKCGSVLEAVEGLVDVHPPRMPAWRRPFRAMRRWTRRGERISEKLPTDQFSRAWDAIVSDALIGFFLSIVPGLAHCLNGRFREVRRYVLLWLVLLLAGLFLYGSTPGSLLIGLAIGLHAWIGLQYGYGAQREFLDLRDRLAAILAAIAFLGLLYWATPQLLFRGYTGGYTALTIPAMRVHEGDYLIVRRLAHSDEPLPPGTLVLIRPPVVYGDHRTVFGRDRSMIGQIIGCPGQTVQITAGSYTVAGQTLDPNHFPVPGWLASSTTTVRVDPGHYFVSSPYTVQANHGARPTGEVIRQAVLVEAEAIEGRAVMCWWPLRRRGFIE